MAIRGKVKNVTIDPMGRATGTVTDTVTKTDYPFEQPYGQQLGLEVNSIVQFDTVDVSGVSYGVSLDPVDKATIQSIDYIKGKGVIVDNVGNQIEFEQSYGRELGLVNQSKVKFVPVTVNGVMKATSLKLVTN
ncbi:MAG: hypothetical protein SFY56_11705 [Bacteroidota bacterium]|nr:hypothetical protein [Bacteroidota bacterium]